MTHGKDIFLRKWLMFSSLVLIQAVANRELARIRESSSSSSNLIGNFLRSNLPSFRSRGLRSSSSSGAADDDDDDDDEYELENAADEYVGYQSEEEESEEEMGQSHEDGEEEEEEFEGDNTMLESEEEMTSSGSGLALQGWAAAPFSS